jgi:hypothetical protein
MLASPPSFLFLAGGVTPRQSWTPNKLIGQISRERLQERARKDHNATLELIRRAAERLGGRCWYNNNIDLFARREWDRFHRQGRPTPRAAQ